MLLITLLVSLWHIVTKIIFYWYRQDNMYHQHGHATIWHEVQGRMDGHNALSISCIISCFSGRESWKYFAKHWHLHNDVIQLVSKMSMSCLKISLSHYPPRQQILDKYQFRKIANLDNYLIPLNFIIFQLSHFSSITLSGQFTVEITVVRSHL